MAEVLTTSNDGKEDDQPKCWKCEEDLIELYNLYAHPEIDYLPVCSVCLEHLETLANAEGTETAASRYCMACGYEADQDESTAASEEADENPIHSCHSCDMCACQYCIQKAYRLDTEQPENLPPNPCLSCHPPQHLLDNWESIRKRVPGITAIDSQPMSADELLDLLHWLETEQDKSRRFVDEQEDSTKLEIRKELLDLKAQQLRAGNQQQQTPSEDDEDSIVQQEWEKLLQYHKYHQSRIADKIFTTIDTLETEYQVDVQEQYYQQQNWNSTEPNSLDINLLQVPDYVQQANLEIQKREWEESKASGTHSQSIQDFEERYEGVEDISALDEPSLTVNIPDCWRAKAPKPQPKIIEECLKAENAKLQQLHVPIQTSTENNDVEETKQEHRTQKRGKTEKAKRRRKAAWLVPTKKKAKKTKKVANPATQKDPNPNVATPPIPTPDDNKNLEKAYDEQTANIVPQANGTTEKIASILVANDSNTHPQNPANGSDAENTNLPNTKEAKGVLQTLDNDKEKDDQSRNMHETVTPPLHAEANATGLVDKNVENRQSAPENPPTQPVESALENEGETQDKKPLKNKKDAEPIPTLYYIRVIPQTKNWFRLQFECQPVKKKPKKSKKRAILTPVNTEPEVGNSNVQSEKKQTSPAVDGVQEQSQDMSNGQEGSANDGRAPSTELLNECESPGLQSESPLTEGLVDDTIEDGRTKLAATSELAVSEKENKKSSGQHEHQHLDQDLDLQKKADGSPESNPRDVAMPTTERASSPQGNFWESSDEDSFSDHPPPREFIDLCIDDSDEEQVVIDTCDISI